MAGFINLTQTNNVAVKDIKEKIIGYKEVLVWENTQNITELELELPKSRLKIQFIASMTFFANNTLIPVHGFYTIEYDPDKNFPTFVFVYGDGGICSCMKCEVKYVDDTKFQINLTNSKNWIINEDGTVQSCNPTFILNSLTSIYKIVEIE